MTTELNTALVALQAALATRALYQSDHPAVRLHLARCEAALQSALARSASVVVMRVDGRVVCDGQVLKGGDSLIAPGGLFALLEQRGASSLTFRAGVTAAELTQLLEQIEVRTPGALRGTPNINLGQTARSDSSAATEGQGGHGGQGELVSSLTNLWGAIYSSGELPVGALMNAVGTLTMGGAMLRRAVLPLASLKRHDEYTFTHTINVSVMSAALSEAVGMTPDAVTDLTAAAMLHDIGKMRTPLALLNKKGALSDSERGVIQAHPVEGARILCGVAGVPEVAITVAFEHHIHIDGTGYPRMPKGWTPHLSAQIVQVADVFDALRTHRPYRAALSLEKVRDIMTGDAGRLYDKDLVEVFFGYVATRAGAHDPAPIQPDPIPSATSEPESNPLASTQPKPKRPEAGAARVAA